MTMTIACLFEIHSQVADDSSSLKLHEMGYFSLNKHLIEVFKPAFFLLESKLLGETYIVSLIHLLCVIHVPHP